MATAHPHTRFVKNEDGRQAFDAKSLDPTKVFYILSEQYETRYFYYYFGATGQYTVVRVHPEMDPYLTRDQIESCMKNFSSPSPAKPAAII
ncbi:hypothetical protein GX51_02698 [Blastomyces parvus]|uniref:Uncharacterized protein n=1 Tax=Blastomyces parvus TaxID=2060905 RepID=A0A2B7XB42_9EURO|nr:hypothetical protein GX51_02698 [Blastomyces parvus]